jgi:hypothetical protein
VRLADPDVQARQRQWFAEHPEEWESAVPLENAFVDPQAPDSAEQ